MIDIEIPHQLKGPNGEQIFMQVFEPQVSWVFVLRVSYFIFVIWSLTLRLVL
jgi:hypothetical protein